MARLARKKDVFAAIADPKRRKLLERLKPGERSVQELTKGMGMTFAGVSLHLQVLHRAGLVKRRAFGRQRFYRLDPRPLKAVNDWTATLGAFWEESLDRLQELLERTNAARDQSQD